MDVNDLQDAEESELLSVQVRGRLSIPEIRTRVLIGDGSSRKQKRNTRHHFSSIDFMFTG